MENIYDKYETSVLKNIDMKNFDAIIEFLKGKNMDFIDELIIDYLDLFLIPYNEFVKKYNKLEEKYGENLVEKIGNDMNILEEFYQ